MNKIVLFIVCLISCADLEAQRYCWGEKYCWGCRRYMDPTYAGYEAIPYGYMDNINYPNRYDLPLNCYFNHRPACSADYHNYEYFMECVRYSMDREN